MPYNKDDWDSRDPEERFAHIQNRGRRLYAIRQWHAAAARREAQINAARDALVRSTDQHENTQSSSSSSQSSYFSPPAIPSIPSSSVSAGSQFAGSQDLNDILGDNFEELLAQIEEEHNLPPVDNDSEPGEFNPSMVHPSELADSSGVTAASGSGLPPAKKSRPSDSNSSSSSVENMDVSSSGGGSEAAPGTGGDNAIGGGSSGQLVIPRPINYTGWYTRSFKKQFKLCTFGLAHFIATKTPTVATDPTYYFLSTSLAEIPVDKLYYYLNKNEFNMLAPGETCEMVKCTVTQRNIRQAFEAGSTTSATATLNQNKNGIYAVGLNKTGYGLNVSPTFGAPTEPMVPTSLKAPRYDEEDMLYGVNNADTNFGSTLPSHQVGAFHLLPNYWAMSTHNKTTGGWPNMQKYVNTYDSANMVGKTIVEYMYKPKQGILKPDPIYRDFGNPSKYQYGVLTPVNNTNVPMGAKEIALGNTFSVTGMSATNAGTSKETTSPLSNLNAQFGYQQKIEKSQQIVSGVLNCQGAQIQPSLHVGVEPVPAITTDAFNNNGQPTSWVDVQSYYDVTFEMMTKFRQHAEFPHGPTDSTSATDIEYNKRRYYNGSDAGTNNTTFMQLYRTVDAVFPS